MALIQTLRDKGVTCAWNPAESGATYLACGTKEGAGGSFDEFGGCLDIYSVNVMAEPRVLQVAGSTKTNIKFESLAWSLPGMNNDTLSGILAGGMSDGSLIFWNPRDILSKNRDACCIAEIKSHIGKATAVQFNPHKKGCQLLASGGSDGNVHIVDLGKLPQPNAYTAGEASGKRHHSAITKLAWNRQVVHILASASAEGSCIIWDLRQKRPWCELLHPHNLPFSSIEWNPNHSSQVLLMTASSHDNDPIINIWDLRKSTSTPVVELGHAKGHRKGILDISWSKYDDGFVVSAGKDNQAILWDLYSSAAVQTISQADNSEGEKPGNLPINPTGMSTNDMVTNSKPRVAGYTSGEIGARESNGFKEVSWSPTVPGLLATCTFNREVKLYSLPANKTNQRAPTWLVPPCFISFGFGGKFVTNKRKCGRGECPQINHPNIYGFRGSVPDKSFFQLLKSRDYAENFLQMKSTKKCKGELSLWEILHVLYSQNIRENLQNVLINSVEMSTSRSKTVHIFSESNSILKKDGVANQPDSVGDEEPVDHYIHNALVCGKIECAIELCIKHNFFEDAFLILSYQSTNFDDALWRDAFGAYFCTTSRCYHFLLKCIVESDLSSFIRQSANDRWLETLTVCCRYSDDKLFPMLCNELGNKLQESDKGASIVCFMFGSECAQVLNAWYAEIMNVSPFDDAPKIEEVLSRVLVFCAAKGIKSLEEVGGAVFLKYASYLISNNLFPEAQELISWVGELFVDAKIIAYRLYWAQINPPGNVPEDPFRHFNSIVSSNALLTSNSNSVINKKHFTRCHNKLDPISPQLAANAGKDIGVAPYFSRQLRKSDLLKETKLLKYQKDGFITSVGNPHLSAKYGNFDASLSHVPKNNEEAVDESGIPNSLQYVLDQVDAMAKLLEAITVSGMMSKRKDDAQKAHGLLRRRFSTKAMQENTSRVLLQVAKEIQNRQYKVAMQSLQPLVKSKWSEEKTWLRPLKSAIGLCDKCVHSEHIEL